uniref:Uncharacterized protein n=1 Tax=Megaselia scalaris TaxID=36166 RepID=T1GWZ6_MEGSC
NKRKIVLENEEGEDFAGFLLETNSHPETSEHNSSQTFSDSGEDFVPELDDLSSSSECEMQINYEPEPKKKKRTKNVKGNLQNTKDIEIVNNLRTYIKEGKAKIIEIKGKSESKYMGARGKLFISRDKNKTDILCLL